MTAEKLRNLESWLKPNLVFFFFFFFFFNFGQSISILPNPGHVHAAQDAFFFRALKLDPYFWVFTYINMSFGILT